MGDNLIEAGALFYINEAGEKIPLTIEHLTGVNTSFGIVNYREAYSGDVCSVDGMLFKCLSSRIARCVFIHIYKDKFNSYNAKAKRKFRRKLRRKNGK